MISREASSNFTLRSFKIDVFLQVSYGSTSKSTLRARLPSVFTKCHACHEICTLVTTSRSANNAIRRKHDTSKVLQLPRKMASEVFKVLRLPQKMQRIFWKRSKTVAAATQTTFDTSWNMWEWHKVPRLPREMKLCDAEKLQTCSMFRFARLTIGTAMASSRGRLRTVANGLRTVAQRLANTAQPPHPPDPCYAFGKKAL